MNVPCRSCKASVRWVNTHTGRRMPLDAWPNAEGNVVVQDGLLPGEFVGHVLAGADLADARARGERLWMPHHATCPQGYEWRRSR